MTRLRYISHPQVRISDEIPVIRWGLTDRGRERVMGLSRQPWISSVARLVSSDETKALETAAILAGELSLGIEVRRELRENDRSSTGYLPRERFETLADAFFASPDESVEGWETSREAQRRVVGATDDLLTTGGGDVVVTGHGGIGTLLLCHLLGEPISRRRDQIGPPAAAGGGNFWTFDCERGLIVHGWWPIEHEPPD